MYLFNINTVEVFTQIESSNLWSALIGAFVGFIFSFFTTWFFTNSDKNKQSEAIWYAMRDEITTNYLLSKVWLDYIEKELIKIKNHNQDIKFKPYFQIYFFNNIILNLPKELKNNHDLFHKIRYISHELEACNDIIKRIEDYKGPFSSSVDMSIRVLNIESLYNHLRNDLMVIRDVIEEDYEKLIVTDNKNGMN